MKLSQFSTLTFDCYGTLIDWETGLYNALQPLFEIAGGTFEKSDAMTAFRKAEGPAQEKDPNMLYRDLLAAVHREIASQMGIDASEEMHQNFSRSIEHWPAFPDSVDALQYLKQHYKLVILSNVDNIGFAYSNRHLQVEFDAVYTAEDIGSYKPNRGNFHYMLSNLSKLGIEKKNILHTAQSLYHDMVPATELGFSTCWIDRRAGEKDSGATPPVNQKLDVDWRFLSLAHMVDAHKAEISSD